MTNGRGHERTMTNDQEQPITVLIADDQELIRSGFKAIFSTFSSIEVVGAAANGREAVELAQQLRPDVVLMDIRMPEYDGISATRDITSNPLLTQTHVLVLTTFDIDQYVYDALSAGASGFLLKDADPEEIVSAIRVVNKGDALIQPSVMRRLVETFVSARPRSMLRQVAGARGGEAGGVGESGEAASGAGARGAGGVGGAGGAGIAGAGGGIAGGGIAGAGVAGGGDIEAAKARAQALRSLTDREREILLLVARGLSNDQIAEELVISPATVKTHAARIMAKTSSHDRAQLVVFAYESGLMAV